MGASGSRLRARWLDWDGRTLRWTVDAPEGPLELALDGIAFRRWPAAAAGECAATFEYAPSGQRELRFELRGSDGLRCAEPWRVCFGAAASPGQDQWETAPAALRPIPDAPPLPARAWPDTPIAVVVPIHNAPASVQRCLDALVRWTPPQVRLILIDDASTDAAIAPLLARFARRANVMLERNARNHGYTHSVNVGIALAGTADVVLLNSDTEVGPRWLPALWFAAHGDATIGTATAVSDNAGAFSVPELEQYCPIPAQWDLATAQRAVLQQAGMRYPQLPTGNGFCMYVKRAVFDRVGAMDADAFPAGYGEENDFCQRAIAAGWRNVIAGNVLVRHERSASFGDARRAALGAKGMAVLRTRWPHYEADVGATLFGFDRRVLDYRVRRAYAAAARGEQPRARVLTLAATPAGVSAALAAAGGHREVFALLAPSCELFAGTDDTPRLLAAADGSDPSSTIAAWLAAFAIEAVLADDVDAFASLVAARAAALGIPVVRTATELRAAIDPPAG